MRCLPGRKLQEIQLDGVRRRHNNLQVQHFLSEDRRHSPDSTSTNIQEQLF